MKLLQRKRREGVPIYAKLSLQDKARGSFLFIKKRSTNLSEGPAPGGGSLRDDDDDGGGDDDVAASVFSKSSLSCVNSIARGRKRRRAKRLQILGAAQETGGGHHAWRFRM